MRRVCVVIGALAFAASAYAETLSFIGEPLAAEATEFDCMDYMEPERGPGGEEAICLDRVFMLRYKVVRSLSGSLTAEPVEFFARYHYSGLPDFTLINPAFIVLTRFRGNLILKGLYPAEELDGHWVACVARNETGCKTRKPVEEVLRTGE